jgi:hypothetical protein
LFAAEGAKKSLFIRLIEDFNILKDIQYIPSEIFQNISREFPENFHNNVTLSAPKIETKIETKIENDVLANDLSLNVDNPVDKLEIPPLDPALTAKTKKTTTGKKLIVNAALERAFSSFSLPLRDKDLANIGLIRGRQAQLKLTDEEMEFQLGRWFDRCKEPHEAPYYLNFKNRLDAFKALHKWLDSAISKKDYIKRKDAPHNNGQ